MNKHPARLVDAITMDLAVADCAAERPTRSRWSVLLCLHLLLVALLVPVLGRAACQPEDSLTLLHFNDFHGQLEPYEDPRDGSERGGIARLAATVTEVRAEDPNYTLIPIDAASPEDPEIAEEVRRITLDADRELDEEVGFNALGLRAWHELIRREEAPFDNFVAGVAREITLADVALLNAGGFRSSIPAGPVSLKSIYQAFPFRNALVSGELTGAQVLAALERSASLEPDDNPGGFFQVSGVCYVIADGRLASASIGDLPIDPARRYRIVTSDFLAAGGDGYAMLEEMAEPVMTGRLISDMVIEGFRTESPVSVETDGRILRR